MQRKLIAAVLLVIAAGCSGLPEKIEANVEQGGTKAAALASATGRSMPSAANSAVPTVVHDDGIWIGRNILKIGAKPLPPIFYEPATFDRTVGSLSELAERITLRAGIPVKVAPDVLRAEVAGELVSDDAGATAQSRRPGQPARPTAARMPQLFNGPVTGAAPAPPQSVPVRITYSNGNFKGLLDTAVARFGVSWKYADGVIEIFHTDVRTFQISAVPGDLAFTANVVSGSASMGGIAGGTGGGTGGTATSGVNANNSQNTTVASRLSVFANIENTVRAMLSPHGKVAASPATGAITVVDTPESLNRIDAYIDNENKVLLRQVIVNVTVLSVSLSENDEYGINWNLVYQALGNKYGITNRFATTDAAAAFSTSVIDSSSRLSGSSVVIEALSKQGKVRRETTASVVTLNNQPVPVQVAKQTSYLQSAQSSVVAQVGTIVSLTPGTVTSGFNMSVLPHVLGNGTVLLQFSGDLSTLRQLRTLESSGSKIEMPELDTRNFLQRVSMKSNETLIISGFEQTDENLNNQGVGHPRNTVFGGGRSAGSSKEIIVILITPTTVTGT